MATVPDLYLLEPAADASSVKLPPRFAEALTEIRAAISRCTGAGIPNDSVLAALMTELMPRLVSAYGPAGIASMLGHIAGEIATAGKSPAADPAKPARPRNPPFPRRYPH